MRRSAARLLPALLLSGLLACEPPAGDDRGAAAARGDEAVEPVYGDTLPGDALAAILGCGACHPGAPSPAAARAAAPRLDGLADRWEPHRLAAYLERPAPLGTGGIARMPDFHLDPAEAAAIALHLLRDARDRRTRRAAAALARSRPGATAERGEAIVAALNCAGCHGGVGPPSSPGPAVALIGDRLRRDWLRDYLAAPAPRRPFGQPPGSGARMPDFRLGDGEAERLTEWLAGATAGPEAPAARDRPTPFRSAKAESLLRDRLSCLGCHRLGGEGGRIGPALDGAGARLRPAYLTRIVMTPAAASPGTVMPEPLEDRATLELIIAHLRTLEGPPEAIEYPSLIEHAPVLPERAAGGGGGGAAALYLRHCAACHGRDGRGDGFNAPDLPDRPTRHADAAAMAARPDATLFDGIHAGGRILGRSHRMPAFGATLTRGEIHALVAHLRTLCGCVQPEWASP